MLATLACDQRLSLWRLAPRHRTPLPLQPSPSPSPSPDAAGAEAGAEAEPLAFIGGIVVEVGDPAELAVSAAAGAAAAGVGGVRLAAAGEGVQCVDLLPAAAWA